MSKITVKKKTENFTILDNTLFKDETISWKAKGLLAYLLHLPNDWQIYLEDLKNRSTDGIDSTRSAMNELIEKGYIVRQELRELGKFKGYEYTVLEKPISVKPKTEKPISDNPTLISTKNTKALKELNTNLTKEKLVVEIEKLNISDFLKESLKEWFDYKQQINNPVKTMLSITKVLNQLGKDYIDEKHLSDSIDFSIGKEYKGIFPKEIKKQFTTTPQNKKIPVWNV